MKKTNKRVQEFIRVDHAGERGAVKIRLSNANKKFERVAHLRVARLSNAGRKVPADCSRARRAVI